MSIEPKDLSHTTTDDTKAQLHRERLARLAALEDDSITIKPMLMIKPNKPLNPRRLLGMTFLLLILFGCLLLCTPWARVDGRWPGLLFDGSFDWHLCWSIILDNFFMATSASCVTGLTVVDVPTYYTDFGQVILLCCIQLGGIGLMTLGTLIVSLLLGRLSSSGESQIVMNYGASATTRPNDILWQTIRYVAFFECVGLLVLSYRYFVGYDYPLLKSLWYGTFHAISAFCNAGISLHSENLIAVNHDVTYMLMITVLVILGGIGFLVISNLAHYRFWRRDLRLKGQISLHSRLVLWTTLILLIVGTTLFVIFEWNASLATEEMPSVYESLKQGQFSVAFDSLKANFMKILTSFAQTTSFRTAGFNYIDLTEVSTPANTLSIILMLIGASPGSMAGGVKTTTVVVLVLLIRAYVRGDQTVHVHQRTIPDTVCREAMVLFVFYLLMVFVFYFMLSITETLLLQKAGSLGLFYEVSSAFGTVGTSLNATTSLSPIGRVIISLAMFLGRIGPLSIAMMMAGHQRVHRVRYPEESVSVG
ncbi:MAG: potassium transporter TrkG [bacterium]|nr:potassium transporter TrkG [bacterium]